MLEREREATLSAMVFRIDSPGSAGGAWVGGSPFADVDGTVISPDYMNAVQEELVTFVEAEGLAPSKTDSTQLRAAAIRLAARLAGAWLTFTAAGSLTGGQGFLAVDVFGVILASVTAGQTATLQVRGTFTLPKVSGDTFAFGTRLYWDAGTGKLTTTSSGNRTVGVSTAVFAPGTTSASVALSGPPNL